MAGFFHRQRYSYRNDVRSVAVDALQFLGNVVFDGFGDVEMQTGDFQIHDTAPSVGSVRRRRNGKTGCSIVLKNYSAVLRLCAAGISRDSLYLAMVRRETSMPRKASRLASASSE